jgi:hypothetical protein
LSSEIKAKFGTTTAFTLTLASLASSTAGVGQQAAIVDNTSDRFAQALISAKVKLGTSPTGGTGVYFFLIRSDEAGTPSRTDGAGDTDAARTIKNAKSSACSAPVRRRRPETICRGTS